MIKKATFYRDVEANNLKLEHNVQLSSCPFCGGEAIAQYASGSYGLTGIRVRCTKCHISTMTELIGTGKMISGRAGFHEVTENEALETAAAYWNKRAEVLKPSRCRVFVAEMPSSVYTPTNSQLGRFWM